MDLALNNLQWLICHKTQTTNQQTNFIRQLFLYTQLNGQTVLFLTIQYNASFLFAHSLNT